MEQGFIDILEKLVKDQGNAALIEKKKCKALLADYTKNEYKKESRLLLQAVEAGIAKAIDGADDLVACKKAKIRDFEEEYGFSQVVAVDIVNVLALVLRGDRTITVSPTAEKVAAEDKAARAAVDEPKENVKRIDIKLNNAPDLNIETKSNTIMVIEDIFSISGRGTVVTGCIKNGIILNEAVAVVGTNFRKQTVVTGIEMFNKLHDEAKEGDNVGILLRGIEKTEIKKGYYLEKL
jgi:translation elongation factor EF-Tu-like GTPase